MPGQEVWVKLIDVSQDISQESQSYGQSQYRLWQEALVSTRTFGSPSNILMLNMVFQSFNDLQKLDVPIN